jgi:pantoate--beta-alanine ligase
VIKIVSTAHDVGNALRSWRQAGEKIGFVPTMGSLHDGHMALVKKSRNTADRTIVSIFVNPAQFGPNEDFRSYPRPLEADRSLLTDAGCDLLFAPSVEEMYPPGFVTKIDPGQLATVLEGAFRPGHFSGVATVVAKLLIQVMPDYAFFGEKDYQQLLIVRQTVQDLCIPTKIVSLPIVREADGLALSSRNVYLSPEERQKALVLSATLRHSADYILEGRNVNHVLDQGRIRIAQAGLNLDYLDICATETLAPIREIKDTARILVAAHIGKTRLIDNMAVFLPLT